MTAEERALLARIYDGLSCSRFSRTTARTTIGERLVGVETITAGDHRMGVAHRPPGSVEDLIPADALELARWSFDPPTPGSHLEAALGIAALNALSAPTVGWRRGDPMAALAGHVDTIATVGLFRPAFRKFDAVDVRVIERRPVIDVQTPSNVSVTVDTPADREAAIAGADVLFVTGSSLVYGGTAAYLREARDVSTVVLIGATASFLPRPAFDAGVTIVAGARVSDPGEVRMGIEAGLCGTDLHDRGLEKVYVAADPAPPGLEFDAGDGGASARPD